MESTRSRYHTLLWLILPFIILATATKGSGLPARSSEEDAQTVKDNHETSSTNDGRLLLIATVPFSSDKSACSSAYSCFDACGAGDRFSSTGDMASNASRLVIRKTMENLCFCDSRCKFFGDCCHDVDTYCFLNNTDEYVEHSHFTGKRIEYLPANYPEADGELVLEDQESFECINVEQYPSSSFWAKTVCRPDWSDGNVKDLCVNPDPDDILTQLPVIDSYKTVYRNAFCAECNDVWNYKFMLLDSVCRLSIPTNIINKRQLFSAFLELNCVTYIRSGFAEPPRSCLKTVNTCSKSFLNINVFESLREACDGPTQFPLLQYENPSEAVVYKNPECAVCNGCPPGNLRCFKLLPENEGEKSFGVNERAVIEHSDIYGKLYMDAAASAGDSTDELHHVITNYNSDMTRTVILNEGDRYIVPIIHECPYGAVFDPFEGKCRQIHCETGYVLDGNECVLDVNVQGIVDNLVEFTSGAISRRNNTPRGHRFKLIIRVNVSMDGRPVLEFLKNNSVLSRFVDFFNSTELICDRRRENSTYAFQPMRPRWMNNTEIDVTYNATGDGKVLIVLVYSPSIPSLDLSSDKGTIKEFLQNLDRDSSVVVAADYEVYVDDKELDTKGLDLMTFINVIAQKVRKILHVFSSCEESLRFVHSSKLTISNDSDLSCPNVSVSGEDNWQSCNETIIFSSDRDQLGSDGHEFIVLLCDSRSELPAGCPRLQYNASEYTLLRNDTAVVENGQTYDKGEYEINDGHLVVCSNFSSNISEIHVFFFGFTVGQIYLTFILGIVSDICLTITIVTYLIFKELRTLPGLNLLGLMTASICCNFSLLLGLMNTVGSVACQVGAIFIHYYTLANLAWMTSIAFDAYLAFGGSRRRIFTHFRSNYPRGKRYLLYSTFAWGMPGALVGMGILFDLCECGPFPVWYGRYISCWINDPYGFLYLFTIPASLILLSNYVLFVLAVTGIKSSQFGGSSAKLDNKYNSANAKKDIAVYIKLLTTTGFGWVFGYIAAFSEITALWSFFLILVSLQGVFIFLAFFCNRRVLELFVSLIKGTRDRRLNRGSSSSAAVGSSRSSGKTSPPSISENITNGKAEIRSNTSEAPKNENSARAETDRKEETMSQENTIDHQNKINCDKESEFDEVFL